MLEILVRQHPGVFWFDPQQELQLEVAVFRVRQETVQGLRGRPGPGRRSLQGLRELLRLVEIRDVAFDRITEHSEDFRITQESPIRLFHEVLRAPDQLVVPKFRVDFHTVVAFKPFHARFDGIIIQKRVRIPVQALKNS